MQAFRHRANFSERAQSSRHQEDNVDRDTCWKGDSRERSSRHQDNDVNRDVRWKGDLRERSSRHQDNAGHRDARREVDSRERSQSYHQDNEKKPHARCNALPPLAPVAVSSIVDLTTESPISFCRSINYNDNDLDAPSLPPRAFFGHKIVSVTQSLPRRKISRPYLAPRLSRAEHKRFKHVLRCDKHIYKDIHDAEEGEVHGNKVGALVVRDIDHLNRAFTALSSGCPVSVKASEVQTLRELVCNKLLCSVCSDSDDYSLLKKCRVAAANADDHRDYFRRLMAYLRDREVVAMLDCDKLNRIGFLVP